MDYDLNRFVAAQQQSYDDALREISNGRKTTHWMWYIFPQLKQLGRSSIAKFYGIDNIDEATAYLRHPVLGPRLTEITMALLKNEHATAHDIFGSPDDMKLRSCMTLFASVSGSGTEFNAVIDKFFDGKADQPTLQLLGTE